MNQRNTAVKRIHADVRELAEHPSPRYHAAPLDDDIFEWHFTIRGPPDTDFAGGIYHGRILLSPEYPFKPPHIIFLTKNGRFEVGTKICLSISAYHPEHWQPAWGVRTMLEAIISFLPTEGGGAVGALDWTPRERRALAKESLSYCCPTCGAVADLLSEVSEEEERVDATMQENIAQMHLHDVSTPKKQHAVNDRVSADSNDPSLVTAAPPAAETFPQTPSEPTDELSPASRVFAEINEQARANEAAAAPQRAVPPAQPRDFVDDVLKAVLIVLGLMIAYRLQALYG